MRVRARVPALVEAWERVRQTDPQRGQALASVLGLARAVRRRGQLPEQALARAWVAAPVLGREPDQHRMDPLAVPAWGLVRGRVSASAAAARCQALRHR